MKIKVYGFTKQDVEQGFNPNGIYEVDSISISGDYCAYDLFYQIKNDLGHKCYVFDLSCDIVNEEQEIKQLLSNIEKIWDNSSNLNIPYKFNYDIGVKAYLDFKNS